MLSLIASALAVPSPAVTALSILASNDTAMAKLADEVASKINEEKRWDHISNSKSSCSLGNAADVNYASQSACGDFKYGNNCCNTKPLPGSIGSCCDKDTKSCFAKDSTMACLVTEPIAPPEAAFEQCYEGVKGRDAKLVLMADLTAGDVVLTTSASGALATTRIIANQHKWVDDRSPMLTIQTTDGSVISMTHDHALFVDGELAAASDVAAGSVLTTAHGGRTTVATVRSAVDAPVINPVTAEGSLLASDQGAPILAASHPMWVAPLVLESVVARFLVNRALAVAGDVGSLSGGAASVLSKLAALVFAGSLAARSLRRTS